MIKEISPKWVKAMDIFHSKKYIQQVKEDVRLQPDIQDKIKGFEDSFINFAALERVNFEADINDELDAYLKRTRMHNTNVKEWYSLRMKVFKRDKFTCQYCGKIGGKLEADHIIPFSKGGGDELSNLVTSCRKCNRQKKDKSKDEFMIWKQGKS